MATGTPEAPSKAGISVADIATGMYAYSGILTALYDRERTGQGASLHVAMIDALGEWMSQPAYFSALRPGAAPQDRGTAPVHLPVRPVPRSRRPGLLRHPERKGVARILP